MVLWEEMRGYLQDGIDEEISFATLYIYIVQGSILDWSSRG